MEATSMALQSERRDEHLGKSYRQWAGSEVWWPPGTERPRSTQSLAQAAHGKCSLRANMTLGFKAHHLGPFLPHRASDLLVSLGHTGRRVVLGHTLNTL